MIATAARKPAWRAYGLASAVVVASTGLDALMARSVAQSNLVMVYLLGVVLVASFLGRGPAILASVLSVGAFDFFFVEPHLTFAVADTQYLITFAVMLVVALTISTLIDQARRLANRAHAASLEADTERLRNALLSAVSHDLRTPLAAITGAASSLATDDLEAATQRELALSIADEADRLNRLVGNLLDVTRLESGAIALNKDWCPLEEIVGAALAQAESRLGADSVLVDLPDDLPLIPMDGVLLQQVLINLLDNAGRHGATGKPVELRARRRDGEVEVVVADRGPGLPPGAEERVFEKFYKAREAEPGVGLGLAICRGIVVAHGGRIWARNRPEGGAEFAFTLPLLGTPPQVELEGAQP